MQNLKIPRLITLSKSQSYILRYVRFINSRRAEVKQQHPHLTFPEITKLLGAEWSNLLQEEKQVCYLVLSFLSLFTSGIPVVILDVSPKLPSFVTVPCNPLKIKCVIGFFFL